MASCIGAWGGGTLRALPLCFCHLTSLLYRISRKIASTISAWFDTVDSLRWTKWRDAGAGDWVARHGRTLGGCRWLGARRGQRLVPLHGNFPPIVPRAARVGPRGNCRRSHAPHFEPWRAKRRAGQILSAKKQGTGCGSLLVRFRSYSGRVLENAVWGRSLFQYL